MFLGKIVNIWSFRIGCSKASNFALMWLVLQYLFDSVMDISVLPCGHTMHQICLGQMNMHSQYCSQPEPLHIDQHITFHLAVFVNLKSEYCGIFESWCLLMSYVVCRRFTCPICSKSTQDMSRIWERLDQEVYLTPMPEEYRQKKVQL